MAKKEAALFEVKENKIYILEENLSKLTEADNTKIAFYSKTLGYEVVFTTPEPKKKNYFTIDKAIVYNNSLNSFVTRCSIHQTKHTFF